MDRSKLVGVVAVAGLAAVGLSACDDINTVPRPDAAQVLTGAQLPGLLGEDPDQIVAFAHARIDDQVVWTQIPVQVDERTVVDFGAAPPDNSTPGTVGTVYGTGSSVSALQYADPATFVGADGDATFDADDELVFMVGDAGGTPREGEETEPAGVVPGSGVEVQLDDPLGVDQQAWVYLFVSPTLDPAAGVDYVDYDFELTSGDYATTYKRADGPNPETSSVTTDTYEIAYPDRWFETDWRVTAAGSTGADVLDGIKNRFALSTCARSNGTFADAEGAFVANVDGPVRGIRSYVGANSGPLTQRTHLMYRTHEVIRTDLRVHAIPGVMDFVDYAPAATGMTYRSSAHPVGVPIDGDADPISSALADWHLVSGPHGSIITTEQLESSLLGGGITLDTLADGFYVDDDQTGVVQCTGDDDFWGASGAAFGGIIPNTDPRSAPSASFTSVRTVHFGAPGAGVADAAAWSAAVRAPLTVTVSSYST